MKKIVAVILVLCVLFIPMTGCGQLPSEEAVQVEEEDVPGMLVICDQVFFYALNQPDNLASNSESFVFQTKIASYQNYRCNTPCFSYGDVAAFCFETTTVVLDSIL